MSLLGPISDIAAVVSALPRRTDMPERDHRVRKGPQAEVDDLPGGPHEHRVASP
jgi:hypothetical protein